MENHTYPDKDQSELMISPRNIDERKDSTKEIISGLGIRADDESSEHSDIEQKYKSWHDPSADFNDIVVLLLECESGGEKLINRLISSSRFQSCNSTGEDRINRGIVQSLVDIKRLGRCEKRTKLIINDEEINPSEDLGLCSSEEYIKSFANLLGIDLKNKEEKFQN